MKAKKRFITACVVAGIACILFLIVSAAHINIVIASGVGFLRVLQTVLVAILIVSFAFAIVNAVIIIDSFRRSAAEGRRTREEVEKAKTNPVMKLVYDIEAYLSANESIDFFRQNLLKIIEQVQRIQKQVSGIAKVAGERFDKGSLSYNQFVTPVQNMLDHLVKLGGDLVQKLELFDEESYEIMIKRSQKGSHTTKPQEYEEVMNSYMEYTKAVADSFENAIIKLDKLVLEIGKLNDEDLHLSLSALRKLDSVIMNTKLYR